MQKTKIGSKVAVYIRVSTSKQEKWSPDAQKHVLAAHCERMGWDPVYYSETGSGETILGRPVIQRLLRDAAKAQFTTCLVVELERLSRDKDLIDWLEIKKTFRDNGIAIATPGQTYNLDDAEDAFLTNLYGALSAREKHKMMERTRRGRMEAKRQNKYLNEYLPYGWTLEGGEVVLHPTESEGLRKMCALALGYSCTYIAKEMTRLGFKSKRGGKWHSATIHHLLVNPSLYGAAQYAEVTWAIPAVITKGEWDVIQSRLKTRFSAPKNILGMPESILRGLLFCSLCGRRLSTKLNRNKSTFKKAFYRYYQCLGGTHAFKDCKLRMVRADDLEASVWEGLKGHLKTPKLIYDALNLVYLERDDLAGGKDQDEAKIGKQIDSLSKEENRLVRSYMGEKAILTEENFRLALQDIRQEKSLLEARLKELRDTRIPDIKDLVSMTSLEGACAQISEGIDHWDRDMQREVMCLLVEKITVFADRSTEIESRIPIFGAIHKGVEPFSKNFKFKTAPIKSNSPIPGLN